MLDRTTRELILALGGTYGRMYSAYDRLFREGEEMGLDNPALYADDFTAELRAEVRSSYDALEVHLVMLLDQ